MYNGLLRVHACYRNQVSRRVPPIAKNVLCISGPSQTWEMPFSPFRVHFNTWITSRVERDVAKAIALRGRGMLLIPPVLTSTWRCHFQEPTVYMLKISLINSIGMMSKSSMIKPNKPTYGEKSPTAPRGTISGPGTVLYCLDLCRFSLQSRWTKVELEAALAREFERGGAYVLPIRLDDTQVSRVLPTRAFLDARQEPIENIAALVRSKLEKARWSRGHLTRVTRA